MAKPESSLKNMVLSLFFISLVMAAALGFVYNITKEPIEEAIKNKEINAIKEVLPTFDNNPVLSAQEIDGILFYKATNQGKTVGYAAKTFTEKGYSGRFDLMVGFLADGTINKIVVLQQKETPGLGANMINPKFKDQFNNVNIGSLKDSKLKVKKDGGTIDAISAATISSRAYCDGIQKAYDLFIQNFAKEQVTLNDSTSNKSEQSLNDQNSKGQK